MSPVDRWGSAKSSCRRSACVPFPAPGGPSRIKFNSSDTTWAAYMATPNAGLLLQESLVTSHHQLRLELLHRFEGHADHDQNRGPAEGDVLVGAGDQDRRQRR